MPDGGEYISWTTRGQFWEKKMAKRIDPLVIAGDGAVLKIVQGGLEVRHGVSHYPQERASQRLYPGRHRLPSAVIIIDASGYVTFDALRWLGEHGVPIVYVDWSGAIVSAMAPFSPVSYEKATEQRAIAASPERRTAVFASLIADKLRASIDTLAVLPECPEREQATARVSECLADLQSIAAPTPDALNGIEGLAAASYFAAWKALPLKWRKVKSEPIPDDWMVIGPRRSPLSGTNRYASHPVAAMLNYAYSVLEGRIKVACLLAGLDQTIGFSHAPYKKSSNSPRLPLVLDLMEPLRPVVDRTILTFIRDTTLHPGDFYLSPEGACNIHPQLTRLIVSLVFHALPPPHALTAQLQ